MTRTERRLLSLHFGQQQLLYVFIGGDLSRQRVDLGDQRIQAPVGLQGGLADMLLGIGLQQRGHPRIRQYAGDPQNKNHQQHKTDENLIS
ncbi:hypothetical protein D3C81_1160540 [compost metagenome]